MDAPLKKQKKGAGKKVHLYFGWPSEIVECTLFHEGECLHDKEISHSRVWRKYFQNDKGVTVTFWEWSGIKCTKLTFQCKVLNWIRKIAGRCHDSAIKKGLGMTKDKLDPDVIQRFKTISNPQPQSPIFLPSHWDFWDDYHRENFNKEIEDSFNDVFRSMKPQSRG